MKKAFEYDLTKYDPSAPKKTEEFLTADGVKTLTTDANDGAVLIQDEVDEDSLNPVTGAAVAAAIEAGGGGGGGTEYSAGDGIDISEDTISAKVDGTTIQINADGELEAIGGGSSYTAGDGIAITSDTIKVDLATNKGLEFAQSTQTTFTADYDGYDLGQWGYMGIGPLHKTSDGLYFQLDFRHISENYLAWNLANGTEYYIFAYDPQDSTKYATCSVPYYADINQSTLVGIGWAWGDGQYEHLYSANVVDWNYFGGFQYGDFDSAAFGIYFPNTVGSSPMGTDYAAVGASLLQNIGYSTTTVIPDAGKLQVKTNENSGIKVDGSGVAVKVDNSTIQVNGNGELFANVSGGTTVLGNEVSMNWNSTYKYCYYDFSSDVAAKITTGIYLVTFKAIYSTAPSEFPDLSAPAMIKAGIWTRTGGQSGFESQMVLLPSTNGEGTSRGFEGTGVFTIDDSSFVPEYFRLQLHAQSGAYISTAPNTKKITVVKIG